MSSCKAIDTVDTHWSFCPNIAAAYVFTVLFAITTIAHLVQAVIYKKSYGWVIIASGFAQFLCYVFRILSIMHPESFSHYAAWFILILVAPLFTNAFVYMTMGRMVWNFVDTAKIYGISASRFGTYFVILDIIAFFIQIGGAATAVGEGKAPDDVLRSLHVYMIGVGIQQFFILVFFAYAFKFHAVIAKQDPPSKSSPVLRLLYILYATLVLISIRIVFRLIEYSQGLTSTIPEQEAYQYCLDSLPMLVALALLNLVHPGAVMRGKESDIPGRKERKALGGRKHTEGHFMLVSQ